VTAVAQAPKPEAAPRRKKASVEDRALIEAAEALLNQQEAPGRSRELQSSFETRTLGGGDKQYTGEPITLNLKDADIKDTLQRFSELTQLNIVLDPDVRGTVTVSLQDIPWDQALELILKINQLGYVLEGNVADRLAGWQEEATRVAFLRAQDQSPVRTVLQRARTRTRSPRLTARRSCPRGDIFVDSGRARSSSRSSPTTSPRSSTSSRTSTWRTPRS
jgi:type II secretory pathway component HofQ